MREYKLILVVFAFVFFCIAAYFSEPLSMRLTNLGLAFLTAAVYF